MQKEQDSFNYLEVLKLNPLKFTFDDKSKQLEYILVKET